MINFTSVPYKLLQQFAYLALGLSTICFDLRFSGFQFCFNWKIDTNRRCSFFKKTIEDYSKPTFFNFEYWLSSSNWNPPMRYKNNNDKNIDTTGLYSVIIHEGEREGVSERGGGGGGRAREWPYIHSVRCLRRISDRRLLATTWHPATAATSPKQTEEIHSHILQAKSNDLTDTLQVRFCVVFTAKV